MTIILDPPMKKLGLFCLCMLSVLVHGHAAAAHGRSQTSHQTAVLVPLAPLRFLPSPLLLVISENEHVFLSVDR